MPILFLKQTYQEVKMQGGKVLQTEQKKVIVQEASKTTETVRRTTDFEEKVVKLLERFAEKIQNKETVDFHLVAKKIKSLYVETLTDEFEKLLIDRTNRTAKRKLYGAPEKSLGDFTIVERWKKPEGYFISFQLPRKLPKDTELQQLLTLFNILTLNAHRYLLYKEICGGE